MTIGVVVAISGVIYVSYQVKLQLKKEADK
jgi:hypothetical protein